MNKKNRNDILLLGSWNLFKVYLLFLLVFGAFRLFFVYYYGELKLLETNTMDFLYAFYLGWKYDTLVTSYFLAPLIIVNIFSALFQSVKTYNFFNLFNRIYLSVAMIVVVVLLVSDMGFYNYFQDHINILFYGIIEDDTSALFKTLSKNYPLELAIILLAAFFILSTFLVFKFLPKMNLKGSFVNAGFGKFFILTIFLLLLLIGGLRGGYGMMVISPKYSDFSEIQFINQTALNGIVTLEKAIKLRATRTSKDFNLAKQFGYGNDIHRAFSDYLGMDVTYTDPEQLINLIKRKTGPKTNNLRPHIVLLVMESFGGHWSQYNAEGFNFLADLKQHFDTDYYFPYFISADNGTIGSLMTLVTNIPNRPGARFLSESRYMQLPLASCSHIPFKTAGYETGFYYGGKLGWRDIGKYLRFQGFDELHGESSIKKRMGLTGRVGTEWGVYDEHLFNTLYQQLDEARKPQFLIALSTTNHPPFEVPESYPKKQIVIPETLKGKIQREQDIFLQRFGAFEYSNQKLAEFIAKIKSSKLGKNTIIAVTGDHNFWGFMNYTKEEAYSKHTVPLYFYIPESLRPKGKINLNKIGSHKDIATTLYELALHEAEYLSFGVNLFGESPNYAFNNTIYADKSTVIFKDNSYVWNNFPLIKKDPNADQSELKKAYQSTLSIADYFIRMTYKNRKKN